MPRLSQHTVLSLVRALRAGTCTATREQLQDALASGSVIFPDERETIRLALQREHDRMILHDVMDYDAPDTGDK